MGCAGSKTENPQKANTDKDTSAANKPAALPQNHKDTPATAAKPEQPRKLTPAE